MECKRKREIWSEVLKNDSDGCWNGRDSKRLMKRMNYNEWKYNDIQKERDVLLVKRDREENENKKGRKKENKNTNSTTFP